MFASVCNRGGKHYFFFCIKKYAPPLLADTYCATWMYSFRLVCMQRTLARWYNFGWLGAFDVFAGLLSFSLAEQFEAKTLIVASQPRSGSAGIFLLVAHFAKGKRPWYESKLDQGIKLTVRAQMSALHNCSDLFGSQSSAAPIYRAARALGIGPLLWPR